MPRVSESHRAARRRQVLDAAFTCFSREGFHRTSMDDIVRESGMSPGAIYGYFSGKSEIIAAIADERHLHEQMLNSQVLTELDPVRALHGMLHAYRAWLTDPSEQMRRRVGVQVWAEASMSTVIHKSILNGVDAARETLEVILHRIADQGRLAPGIDVTATARALIALFQGLILQLSWDERTDLDSYLGVVERFIKHGVLAPVSDDEPAEPGVLEKTIPDLGLRLLGDSRQLPDTR